jgi:hypothetical protein
LKLTTIQQPHLTSSFKTKLLAILNKYPLNAINEQEFEEHKASTTSRKFFVNISEDHLYCRCALNRLVAPMKFRIDRGMQLPSTQVNTTNIKPLTPNAILEPRSYPSHERTALANLRATMRLNWIRPAIARKLRHLRWLRSIHMIWWWLGNLVMYILQDGKVIIMITWLCDYAKRIIIIIIAVVNRRIKWLLLLLLYRYIIGELFIISIVKMLRVILFEVRRVKELKSH